MKTMKILALLLVHIILVYSYHNLNFKSTLDSKLYSRVIIKGFNNDGKNLLNRHDNMVFYLNDSISTLVDISREKFYSGSITDSKNPKPQMGTWTSEKDRTPALQALNDTILATDSILARFIMDCPTPLIIDVIPPTSLYSITFFHSPPYFSLPPRKHIAGTILFYKALYGAGLIKSTNKDRVIAEDQLRGSYKSFRDFTYKVISNEGSLFTRIGGPARTLEYTSNSLDLVDGGSPVGYLEICLFPPDTENDINQLIETNDAGITRLDPPEDQILSLFTSYTASQVKLKTVDVELQDEEAITKKSSKYGDVKSKLTKNIGGLNAELDDICRRLLASRRLPPSILQSLGLAHVRGILMYGPPGTGKTLIAREIAKSLNAREPKIVNGPELLDKFVGEAEKNVRELFREADEEWDRLNYQSELHVIILDEIDSIAKKRGFMAGDGSGVRDSVVNQLLTKIDGVRERNNVLVIGLTNRLDLIDPALIRPGRLEVLIQINEPDRAGREEILYILMKQMILGKFLSVDEATNYASRISLLTSGFTGADLAGLLRSASSFAVNRYYNEDTKIYIKWNDIENALIEMKNSKRVSKRKIIIETINYNLQKLFNPSKLKRIRTLQQILYDT